GKSGLSFCHIFAICAAGDFENDGCERLQPAANTGEVNGRSNQPKRSRALRPRKIGEGNFCAYWSPRIARALRFEPIECALARRQRSGVEGGGNGSGSN